MRIIVGNKDFTLRKKTVEDILSLDPVAEIVECETWDCTLLDLVQKEPPDYLILDLNIMGLDWHDRVVNLLHTLPKTLIILTSDEIDTLKLLPCYQSGLVAYITHHEVKFKLPSILKFVFDEGVYLSPVILKMEILPKKTAARKKDLPGGHKISRRQVEVLTLLEKGMSNKQIAVKMGISEPTVKLHVHGLFKKLDVTNRTQIILKAQKLGLI